MRTTVTLADELMEELMQFTHARTRTDGVNQALKEWLRWRKIQELKKLHGKLPIENNLKELRQLEVKKTQKYHSKKA